MSRRRRNTCLRTLGLNVAEQKVPGESVRTFEKGYLALTLDPGALE